MIEFEFSALLIGLMSLTLLRLLLLLIVHIRMSLLKPLPQTFDQPVSIIICARNEADNLIQFLPKVLEQNYPNYEVIVVNDRSIDNTPDVLRAFERSYPRLKVTHVKENDRFNFNKKFAVTMGIKAAQNEHLLFTDADCIPESENWLTEMVAPFQTKKSIVLGYGAYKKAAGLVNKIIRAETFLIAQQYIGYTLIGLPYMAVGRNLAYTKSVFFDNKGFSSHQHLVTGDDDLFINEVATAKNTAVVFSPNSYTTSIPKKTWSDYLEQKRRHLGASASYKSSAKLLLIALSGLNYAFVLSIICTFIFEPNWWLGLISIVLVALTQMAISYPALKKSKSVDLIIWISLADYFTLLFYPFALVYNYTQSGSLWKNY